MQENLQQDLQNKPKLQEGFVKFYKEQEGYGFVSDGENDYYFNFHAIKGKELPSAGDDVFFHYQIKSLVKERILLLSA